MLAMESATSVFEFATIAAWNIFFKTGIEKAQLREIESRDAPPSEKAQEIAAHFSDLQRDFG